MSQEDFDFLMPFPPSRTLLSPHEVARCLGRSVRHVYDLINEERLEAHAPTGRDKERYMVTRRSVCLLLCETAKYKTGDFNTRLITFLKSLSTRELLTLVIKTATQLLPHAKP